MNAFGFVGFTRIRVARTLCGTRGEILAEVPINVHQPGFYDRDLGDGGSAAVPIYLGDGDRVLKVREVRDEEFGPLLGIDIEIRDRGGEEEDEVIESDDE